MAKIEGINRVLEMLRRRSAAKGKESRPSVVVGYTQNYALYVHEILTSHHPVGQAQYLIQPFRENAQQYATIIRSALAEGKTLDQALLMAGLTLQRDSQLLVPVDTGALKGSAFTRLDKGEESTDDDAQSG